MDNVTHRAEVTLADGNKEKTLRTLSVEGYVGFSQVFRVHTH